MNPTNVLITSAGGAAAINVINALRCTNKLHLVAVDMDPPAAGFFLADESYEVPSASDASFLEKILGICEKADIDVVIPMYSEEIPVFAHGREHIRRRGAGIIIPDPETVEICNDKEATYRFFEKQHIPFPISSPYWNPAYPFTFPLMVKPRRGSGTKNTYRVNDPLELDGAVALVPQPVVQQFIVGREFTVDLLVDRECSVLAMVPRERLKTSAGKCMVGRTVEERSDVRSYIECIVKELKLIGPSNIQYIVRDHQVFFIEINPRFSAGGLPLTVAAGANTPLMLVSMALGEKVKPVTEYTVGLTMVRYLTEMFI